MTRYALRSDELHALHAFLTEQYKQADGPLKGGIGTLLTYLDHLIERTLPPA